MTIEYRQGDILASGAVALVNPVNVVGVSGKGLAKAFARWAPDAQREYEKACHAGQMRPGDVLAVKSLKRGVTIFYVATKGHWRLPSHIDYVARGCDLLAGLVEQMRPPSIAIPALGCGLGGLSYADVKPLIHAAAERMSAAGVAVLLYEPG